MTDRVFPLTFPEVRLRLVTEPPRRRTILLREKAGVEPRDVPVRVAPRFLLFPWVTLAWGEARCPEEGSWLPVTGLRCLGSKREPRGLDDRALGRMTLPSVQAGVVCLKIDGREDPVSFFWNTAFQQGAYSKIEDGATSVALVECDAAPRAVLAGLVDGSYGAMARHVLRCRAHAAGDAGWSVRCFDIDHMVGVIRLLREESGSRWTEEDWRG